MNAAHWHLLLNHLPVIGVILGVLLLLLGILRKSDDLKQASLGILIAAAAFAIPTYLTGEPAEELAEHLPGVTKDLIHRHEDIAKIAMILTSLTGLIALIGLFWRRRAQWLVPMALVFGLIAAGALGYTAYLGGQIRHTEIRADFKAAPNAEDTATEEKKEAEKNHDEK